ncbi:putative WRKY transcription factor 35 [Hordeum vulgare]|nr:putative WRKY transcription factor 35 [Hordeum vulgare]
MSAGLDADLKWSREDYVREEMERQLRALEEITERRRGLEEDGVIILSDIDEEETAPTPSFRSGDPRSRADARPSGEVFNVVQ